MEKLQAPVPVNPYANRRPVPAPDEFYGREEEVIWLLEQTLGEVPQCCSLVGVRRIGKTWLLRFLAHPEGARRRYPEYVFREALFLYLDMSTASSGHPVRQIVRQAARALAQTPGHQAASDWLSAAVQDEDPAQAGIEAFQDVVKSVGRLVLLLDEIDNLEMWRDGTLAPFLRRLASETPVAIVTASFRQLHELLETEEFTSPLYNIFWTRFLGMMPADEAHRLLVEPAREYGVEWPDRLVERVLSQTGGHPDLIKLAGAHMWNLWHAGQKANLTWEKVRETMWPDVEGVFASIERHLTSDEIALLRAIAGGHPPDPLAHQVLDRLKRYDLVRATATGWQVFGDLFCEWLLAQKSEEEEEERVRLEGPFLRVDGHRVLLTETEQRLVTYLLQHRGQVCPRETLRQEVLGHTDERSKALEMVIRRLRAKLERESPGLENHIVTVRGVGYMWQ